MSNTLFRKATKADIDALVDIENCCFTEDKLTKRNFHWMLLKANADIMLAHIDDKIVGYGLLLYRRGTSLARIYSLAVLPDYRGTGLAVALLTELEQSVRDHECVYLRLEVRPDNARAIALYQRLGYRQFDRKLDYYEDHSEALCFEKRITYPQPITRVSVPYYCQTTEFTCGPATLLMAMSAIEPSVEQSQVHELQIWRESTTIFMTAGHGGCGPHGLALAAYHRGFNVEMYLSDSTMLFIDSVRSTDKRQVISLVQEEFLRQLRETPVKIHYQKLSLKILTDHLDAGRVPIIMISTYRINRNKAPHWVVITAHDSHFIYIHDPDADNDEHSSMADNVYVPVPKSEFLTMARFGRSHLQTALILSHD
jgi:ribosomal-protein-alanine acetyltransferase